MFVRLFEKLRLARGCGKGVREELENLGERQEEEHGWQVLRRVPCSTQAEPLNLQSLPLFSLLLH